MSIVPWLLLGQTSGNPQLDEQRRRMNALALERQGEEGLAPYDPTAGVLPGAGRLPVERAANTVPLAPSPIVQQVSGARKYSLSPGAAPSAVQPADVGAAMLPYATGQKKLVTKFVPEIDDKNMIDPTTGALLQDEKVGRKTVGKGSQKYDTTSTDTEVLGLPQYRETARRWKEEPPPAAKALRDFTEKEKTALLKAIEKASLKEDKLDLSPLFALSDTWFGGNLLAGYKPPKDDKLLLEQMKTRLQNLLTKAADDEQAFFNSQLKDRLKTGMGLSAEVLRQTGTGPAAQQGSDFFKQAAMDDRRYKMGKDEEDKDYRQYETFGKSRNDSRFASLYSSMKSANDILSSGADINAINYGGKEYRIPGGVLNEFLGTPEGVRLEEDMANLRENVQNYLTGAAAPAEQSRRIKGILGENWFSSLSTLKGALKRLRDEISVVEKNRESTLLSRPGARRMYNDDRKAGVQYGSEELGTLTFGEGKTTKGSVSLPGVGTITPSTGDAAKERLKRKIEERRKQGGK